MVVTGLKRIDQMPRKGRIIFSGCERLHERQEKDF